MDTQDVRRLRELEQENSQLKRLLAERDLEIDAVWSLIRKNGWALPNAQRERGF
jgi:putative transposase